MSARKNLVGLKFGRLTVYSQVEGTKRTSWLCKCECGNFKTVTTDSLRSGRTKSCGCLRKENTKNMRVTHGLRNTKLYGTWVNIKTRCYSKDNEHYKYYGSRGIEVCQEWLNSFLSFYEWSTTNGYQEGLTIDRIDVNGNYEPNNCRWVSMKAQNNNKRNSYIIEYNGKKHTLSEWSDILGIPYGTLWKRIRIQKWSIEKTFQHTPERTKKCKRKN